MPVIQAHKISYQFNNGDVLFENISCTLSARRVGLVGRNGIGKSYFADMLAQKRTPTSGSVVTSASVACYSQLPSRLLESSISIAEFLGYQERLHAIERIEKGDCDPKWFEIVGENWQLKQALNNELDALGLPPTPHFSCKSLSGGQLARLQLWKLFQSDVELLILDEPSNHLDQLAKQWLIDQMNQFQGHLVLVSHDRQLLRQMEQIWELSQLGLTQYGGNFDAYEEQKQRERTALERQLDAVRGEQYRLEVQAQKNREKAQQRESQGNKIRKSGSQSKLILDGMKNSAENSVLNRHRNENSRRTKLEQKERALSERYEQVKQQRLYLEQGASGRGNVFNMVAAVLPFGVGTPFNLALEAGSKLHLSGGNGSGKSTLLKVLSGEMGLKSGELHVNRAACYLDQHFGLLSLEHSLLSNMTHHCEGMLESDARTLLAGIGFRTDSVFRLVSELSGGEKMKLAMLIVSHQPQSPILLLDEPDNHLDLDSKQMLADALKRYQGAFILVSHDEDFVRESGVERTFTLTA